MDNKNRISIPSGYRSVIESCGPNVVYGFQSITKKAIEICTKARMEELHSYIENLPIYSDEREAMELAILASAEQLNIDAKGRVTIPERLMKYSEIENECVLVGKGRTFEIWSEKNLEDFKNRFKNHKITLQTTGN